MSNVYWSIIITVIIAFLILLAVVKIKERRAEVKEMELVVLEKIKVEKRIRVYWEMQSILLENKAKNFYDSGLCYILVEAVYDLNDKESLEGKKPSYSVLVHTYPELVIGAPAPNKHGLWWPRTEDGWKERMLHLSRATKKAEDILNRLNEKIASWT